MNWKMNYWTIAFLGSMILFLSGFLDGLPSKGRFQLESEKAIKSIDSYQTYITGVKYYKVMNPDVQYFKFPKGQIHEMAEKFGKDDEVNAYLALEKNARKLYEINLVFAGQSPSGEETIFYGGASPCPDQCDEWKLAEKTRGSQIKNFSK